MSNSRQLANYGSDGNTTDDYLKKQDASTTYVDKSTGNLTRYDLAITPTTDTLDLAIANEFTIDASSPRTLSFANIPTGRSMTIVLSISGSSAITWPAEMAGRWHDGAAPELGATWTIVVINYDGANFSGVLGASA